MANPIVRGRDGSGTRLYRTAALVVAPIAAADRGVRAIGVDDTAATVAEVRVLVAPFVATPGGRRRRAHRVAFGRDLARTRAARAALAAILACFQRVRSAVDIGRAAAAIAHAVAVTLVALPRWRQVAVGVIVRGDHGRAVVGTLFTARARELARIAGSRSALAVRIGGAAAAIAAAFVGVGHPGALPTQRRGRAEPIAIRSDAAWAFRDVAAAGGVTRLAARERVVSAIDVALTTTTVTLTVAPSIERAVPPERRRLRTSRRAAFTPARLSSTFA